MGDVHGEENRINPRLPIEFAPCRCTLAGREGSRASGSWAASDVSDSTTVGRARSSRPFVRLDGGAGPLARSPVARYASHVYELMFPFVLQIIPQVAVPERTGSAA